jgi:alcohol dehydrogenase class IV
MPAAHFGVGAVSELPGVVRGSGCSAAVIVTDQALAGTPVVARVRDVLAADGMTHRMPDLGITAADFDLIAADALDDEVMTNTPRPPAGGDIQAILAGALRGARGPAATRSGGPGPDGG